MNWLTGGGCKESDMPLPAGARNSSRRRCVIGVQLPSMPRPGHTDTEHSLWGRMLVAPDSHWFTTNKVDVWSAFQTTIIYPHHNSHKQGWLPKSHDFGLPPANTVRLYLNCLFHVIHVILPFTDQVGTVTLVRRTAGEVTISTGYKVRLLTSTLGK